MGNGNNCILHDRKTHRPQNGFYWAKQKKGYGSYHLTLCVQTDFARVIDLILFISTRWVIHCSCYDKKFLLLNKDIPDLIWYDKWYFECPANWKYFILEALFGHDVCKGNITVQCIVLLITLPLKPP